MLKKAIIILALLAAVILIAGRVQEEKGTLSGHVTIGPLCPQSPCRLSPEEMADVLGARKIIITAKGGAVVETLSLDSKGNYRAELDPGQYTADINHFGNDRSPNAPMDVTIKPLRTTSHDIRIEAGTR